MFAPGLLYHVIVCGNQQQETFRSEDDYRVYLDRLERYRTRWEVTTKQAKAVALLVREYGYTVGEVAAHFGPRFGPYQRDVVALLDAGAEGLVCYNVRPAP